MKRSTKIILITSACLIFGGILIAGISGAVGGTKQFKELADKQAFDFELPWDDAHLKLTTEGIYYINNDADEEEMRDGKPEIGQEVVDEETGKVTFVPDEEVIADAEEVLADWVTCVQMELGAGNIEIKKSENGSFYIKDGKNIYMNTDYEKGIVEIYTKSENEIQIFGFTTNSQEIVAEGTIYLPDQVYEEVILDMGAGEFRGELPECKKLEVRLGAGECIFDSVKAEEMELEVGAGECKIGYLEAAELDADIAMGEFTAKALIGRDLDAKVGMGEIAMDIIGEETDFNYDVEVGAGEVQIGSRSYSGVGSGGSKDDGLDRTIDVECGMGQATLKFVKE